MENYKINICRDCMYLRSFWVVLENYCFLFLFIMHYRTIRDFQFWPFKSIKLDSPLYQKDTIMLKIEAFIVSQMLMTGSKKTKKTMLLVCNCLSQRFPNYTWHLYNENLIQILNNKNILEILWCVDNYKMNICRDCMYLRSFWVVLENYWTSVIFI